MEEVAERIQEPEDRRKVGEMLSSGRDIVTAVMNSQ